MTIEQAEKQLIADLSVIYDPRESAAIAGMVMEHVTGYPKIDRIIHKTQLFSEQEEILIKQYREELIKHRPVQYVLGEAWFMGMRFRVNEKVLIPRPETEELANWIIEDIKAENSRSPVILDVGTGSGCIPISLSKSLPAAVIHSCDISQEAINVARLNAQDNTVNTNFIVGDFLDESFRATLPAVDYIVSNPPYIPVSDIKSISPNVVNYEPHLALFVPDKDPLVFYRALARFAKEKLYSGGKLFAELHVEASVKAKQLFLSEGLSDVEIRKDLHGNPRMIKATMLP